MEGGSLFNSGFLGASFYGGSGRLLTTLYGEIIFSQENIQTKIVFLDGVEDIR